MSSNSKRLSSWAEKRYQQWLAKQIPATDEIILNRRIIFILPSKNGVTFSIAIALIFIAAINYAISLAFGLTFMMVSIFILTILYSFNNLHQLRMRGLPTTPVFCGEDAAFTVLMSRRSGRSHESLELNFPNETITRADLTANDQEKIRLYHKTTRRGIIKAPRIRIATYYPLGLCRAWSVVDMNMHCLVYPAPVPVAINQLANFASGRGDAALTRDGSEDFYGLRNYVVGDSMKQVAWKNVARGQGMQVKQFVEYVDDKVWLDWDMFYGFSVEERLSRLCYCVLQLSKSNTAFGLKLPDVEISPDKGTKHKVRLLERLAMYKVEQDS